jgi:aromatic-amino-acid transaminase
MFQALPEAKPDAILQLLLKFREDPRTNKVDLGVGVYKDEHGQTPVMKAVKQAEKQLLETQDTKAYVAPIGSRPFSAAMITQVFGSKANTDRIRAAQSTGGTGALRILCDLLKLSRPDAAIWVSDPTWPNHIPIINAAGIELKVYPYYDTANSRVDFDNMMSTLNNAAEGDIVLLHGCCHNPTGADLNLDQWQQLADLCAKKSLFPFFDLAYQGFGDGLEEDAASVRLFADQLPELVVAASCSKNLALYRERTGVAMLLAENAQNADRALGSLGSVIRSNYSMPPDHGASVTDLVLSDANLNNVWREELDSMRIRMVSLRRSFAEAMRKRSNSDRFDYIINQKGMFSRLPLNAEQITTLREQHGIYIVGDGRINVAGLPEDNMDSLADAIFSVL